MVRKRKHYEEIEQRFWVDDRVGMPDVLAALPGWWGVVDEEKGGVVAFADDEETAVLIRDALRTKYGEE